MTKNHFKRIVLRQIVAPRGALPFIRESLQCGHTHKQRLSYATLEEMKSAGEPPKRFTKPRERLCSYCLHGLPDNSATPAGTDVVWARTYNLLTDIAQAYADAEEAANGGSEEVHGSS